jgi:hypothetical protein
MKGIAMSQSQRRARALVALAVTASLTTTGCWSSDGPRIGRGTTVEPTTASTVPEPTPTSPVDE